MPDHPRYEVAVAEKTMDRLDYIASGLRRQSRKMKKVMACYQVMVLGKRALGLALLAVLVLSSSNLFAEDAHPFRSGLRFVDSDEDEETEKTSSAFSLRKNPYSQSLPYFYTAYLLVAAHRSGPGWVGESGWALGGLTVGALAAVVGVGIVANLGPDLSADQSHWALLPLMALPIIAQVQSVRKHQADHRQDRTWERFGYSSLGSATAGGLFWVFPTETGYSWPVIITAMCLGSVVGYRLAF